ncbi:hypothetical protein EYC59_03580 [Candidatus Saccharibacteria bacterium]|nr:MAG: hypothetical protein EYC59_03580 [Candidatus Saccharibacteria bacterium]
MLFGHQDNSRLAAAGTNTDGVLAGGPPALDPSGTAGLPSIPENFDPEATSPEQQGSALNQNVLPTQTITPTAPDPIAKQDDTPHPAINTIVQPSPPAQPTPTANTEPVSRPEPAPDTPSAGAKPFDANLLSLKQQALAQLEPLVGHLDQTPEEKFRTTMMLIQSADNQTLIQTAYEAAQAIPDEKAKAQALLDVVNEINYFAQKSKTN